MANENNSILIELADALSSIKQRKFVMFYVENGGNGTAAAEAAGYAAPAVSACNCLKNEKIKEQIKRYSALCARNAGESRETILSREVNWAAGDIRSYFYRKPILMDDGTPATNEAGEEIFTEEMRPITSWSKEEAQRVKKISWNRNGPVLELHDPMRANRNLAEYAGMLRGENEALNAEDAAQLIAAAMERMDDLDHAPATS